MQQAIGYRWYRHSLLVASSEIRRVRKNELYEAVELFIGCNFTVVRLQVSTPSSSRRSSKRPIEDPLNNIQESGGHQPPGSDR